jgi:hypothetical protein
MVLNKNAKNKNDTIRIKTLPIVPYMDYIRKNFEKRYSLFRAGII